MCYSFLKNCMENTFMKWNEIITDSNQGLILSFLDKHRSLGLLDIKTHKKKRMKIYFAVATPSLEWFFLGLLKDGREGAAKRNPISKIGWAYSTMMKLSTVIYYLKKIQKIYESRHTSWVLLKSAFFHWKPAKCIK